MRKRETQKIGRRRKRFTLDEKAKVVTWLKERSRSPAPAKITWRDVETFSGFSKMRLSRDQDVSLAYHNAKSAIRGVTSRRRALLPAEARLQQRVKELEGVVARFTEERNRWLSLWDRWQYNAHRKGWNVKELDRSLPSAVHRKIARGGNT